MDRRSFISGTTAVSAGVMLGTSKFTSGMGPLNANSAGGPLILATWDFGLKAADGAWTALMNGGSPVDAVESGIRIIEADPDNLSVGIGGLPDREGIVTLDACIMDELGRAGSVTFLQEIMHPISVAKLVMEKTPHVILSGKGAQQFALENGFPRQNLLTEKSKKAWEEWKQKSEYKPVINLENHDTVGLILLTDGGRMAGGCSTSGLAYKMHGRVGDSPVIGAGLYLDPEIGAAVATGLGEKVLRELSTFLVIELMRSGASPQDACQEAISRIVRRNPDYKEFQVGIIALNLAGEHAAFSIQPGFSYALKSPITSEVRPSKSYL